MKTNKNHLLIFILLIIAPVTYTHADADKAEQLFQEGKLALVRGHTVKAEIKLLLANREMPERSDIIEQLAMVYHIQKEHTKGLKLVDELLGKNPSKAELHILKGQLLQHLGKLQAARDSYISAGNFAPKDPAILAKVGGFFLLTGDVIQAETYSQRVKALQNTKQIK